MIKDIIFYNTAHIGDIILTKPFVKEICKQFGTQNNFFFSHSYENKTEITTDFLPFTPLDNNCDPYSFSKRIEDKIYINTWFGFLQNDSVDKISKYNTDICFFEFFKSCFNYYMTQDFNIDLSYMNEHDVMWEIEGNINLPISGDKNILVFNTRSESGSYDTNNLDFFINGLAEKFLQNCFFMTNNFSFQKENVYDLNNFSLRDIAIISKKCDIVIGGTSGPYLHTLIRSNLMDENKIFLPIQSLDHGATQWSKNQLSKSFYSKETHEAIGKLENLLSL
jgi:hypothetical protein